MPIRLPPVLRFGPSGARRLSENLRAADRAMAAGDWAVAAAHCAEVLAADPGRWPMAVQLGHALKEQGFLRRAEAAYRQALDRRPDSADTYLQLGHVLKLQQRRPEAAQAYALAHRLAPGREEARRELAALGATLPPPEDSAALARRLRRGAAHPVSTGRPSAAPAHDAITAALERADLSAALLPLFDEVFYVEANPSVRAALGTPDRAACLVHFCDAGLDALLPFSAATILDPRFYCDMYCAGRGLAPAVAYRHWLTLGLARGWAANRDHWLDRTCGIGPRRAAMLSESSKAALFATERRGGAWVDLFDECRAAGAFDRSGGEPLRHAFADRAARHAQGDAAERAKGTALDARLLALDPEDAGARLRTAEGLHREGFATEALPLFAALVGSPARSLASTLGLAACLEATGAPETALDVLAASRTLFAGEARLDAAFEAIAARLLHRAFRLAMAGALSGSVDTADAGLAGAVAHVAGLMARSDPGSVSRSTIEEMSLLPSGEKVAEGRMRGGPQGSKSPSSALWAPSPQRGGDKPGPPPPARRPIRRIAIVGNGDLPQCRLYRIAGKLEQLAAAGLEAAFFDFHTAIPAFLNDLHRFDAAIFYRVAADAAVIGAIAKARAVGVLTICETDDLIFDAAHYPEDLASYGGAIDAREHTGLRLGVPLMAGAMRLCDVGLASTPSLAAAMAPLVRSGRTFVHRNALGIAHTAAMARPAPPCDNGRITIFYGSGTKAHAADFCELVAPALAALVRRHGTRIRIVLVGHVPATDAMRAIEGLIERHGPLPPDAFWALLAAADINLAVLKPSAMADAKSEIKWLEAAMLGIPSVVSATATFRDIIEPGIDGFLCASVADWTATLDRLVADPVLRRTVGARAKQAALARYGPADAAENLVAILRSLSPPASPGKPKVLVVNVYYPPQNIGGATRVVHDNVTMVAAMDAFDLTVFASTEGSVPYALATFAQDGVRVTTATIPAVEGIDDVLDDPRMGEVFARYLDDIRPDLIHFHCIQRLTIAVVDAAHAAGIPYVVTMHDGFWVSDEQFVVDRFGTRRLYAIGDPEGTRRRLGPAAAARMQRIAPALLGAKRILTVSKTFAALLSGCGVPDVLALPNGLSGAMGGARTLADRARLRLGFVGGLHDHKGWRLVEGVLRAGAVAAFDLLAVDHALPAGQQERAVFGATPVTFIPRVDPAAVASLYARIDILLAPSIWPESFGLVAREALACGCWVVASDRGAVGEDIVEGGNGFVIDVSGPDGLAAILGRIAADPDRFRQPPSVRTPLRMAADQASDLAALYTALTTPPLDPGGAPVPIQVP